MITLDEALKIFSSRFPNDERKVVAYWKKDDGYVLQTEFDGFYASNFFYVKNDSVMGTDPMHAKLNIKDRKRL